MLVFGRSHTIVTSLVDAGHRHCFVCVDILVTSFIDAGCFVCVDILVTSFIDAGCFVCGHSSHKFY